MEEETGSVILLCCCWAPMMQNHHRGTGRGAACVCVPQHRGTKEGIVEAALDLGMLSREAMLGFPTSAAQHCGLFPPRGAHCSWPSGSVLATSATSQSRMALTLNCDPDQGPKISAAALCYQTVTSHNRGEASKRSVVRGQGTF